MRRRRCHLFLERFWCVLDWMAFWMRSGLATLENFLKNKKTLFGNCMIRLRRRWGRIQKWWWDSKAKCCCWWDFLHTKHTGFRCLHSYRHHAFVNNGGVRVWETRAEILLLLHFRHQWQQTYIIQRETIHKRANQQQDKGLDGGWTDGSRLTPTHGRRCSLAGYWTVVDD